MFSKLWVLGAGPDSQVYRPQTYTLGLSPEWGWSSCFAPDFLVQSGSKPQPETNYVTPPLWTQSGAATGRCLMITMVGNGLRMSCNNTTVGDNTAQLYHALECYRAPFQRLLGYGPCPVRGVGQGPAILYFALLLLVPVIITPAALFRWYPLFSQPLGIPRVCPCRECFYASY